MRVAFLPGSFDVDRTAGSAEGGEKGEAALPAGRTDRNVPGSRGAAYSLIKISDADDHVMFTTPGMLEF